LVYLASGFTKIVAWALQIFKLTIHAIRSKSHALAPNSLADDVKVSQ